MSTKRRIDQQSSGFWPSQVSAALVSRSNKRIRQIACIENAQKQQALLWVEARPELAGRCVLMIQDYQGQSRELLNHPEFSVRSLINSYGGGALLFREDVIYFVNYNPLAAYNDQRIYRLELDDDLSAASSPTAITAEENSCYGDLSYDEVNKRILCIREYYLDDEHRPQDIIAIGNLTSHGAGELTVLVSGFDFFSSPALSPAGDYLSYIAWDHPNMPWDNSELHLLKLDSHEDLKLSLCTDVALSQGESVQQARWHSDGNLYYISDRSNYWQLYRYDLITQRSTAIISDILNVNHPLHDAEFASPGWELGQFSYDFVDEHTLVVLSNKSGCWTIQSVNLETNTATAVGLELPILISQASEKTLDFQCEQQLAPFDFFSHLHASSTSLICIAASVTSAAQLIRVELATHLVEVISQTDAPLEIALADISQPIHIRFSVPSNDIAKENTYAHAFFYAPRNSLINVPDKTLPPLIIKTHGGPTSSTSTQLDWSIQFFTNRGFAVVDINYQGSTGYGRNYRHALYGRWGVADLQDCTACIDYLIAENKVDAQRVFARGQSAGGYLTLMLASFTNRLCAGASTAGISDLTLLYQQTHKFEKEYLFNLLACRPDTDSEGIYKQRSPLYAPKLKTPLLFIQGSEDKVVPVQQTQNMLARLEHEGIRAEYLLFSGEQHGLRKSENIEKALIAELNFFRSFL